MAFDLDTVVAAWRRANGRCEYCGKPLAWSARGNDYALGGWEAHHVIAVEYGGPDTLENCRILCIPCHKKTPTYGR